MGGKRRVSASGSRESSGGRSRSTAAVAAEGAGVSSAADDPGAAATSNNNHYHPIAPARATRAEQPASSAARVLDASIIAPQPLLPSEFSSAQVLEVVPASTAPERDSSQRLRRAPETTAERLNSLLTLLDSDNEQSDTETTSTFATKGCGDYCLASTKSSDSKGAKTVAVQPGSTTGVACRWRECKRVGKASGTSNLLACSRVDCEREVHSACVAAMLAVFGADDNFNQVVCGRRCYNALIKLAKKAAAPPSAVKKRVMWHNDGPTEHISSLSVLIDWITDGDNYDRYRGGDDHSGETKIALAEQISRQIASKGITTVRTAKDITNKISTLESTFRAAVDWLRATGQGVQDEDTLRQCILKRCPEYYELFDTMNSRVSTRAQLLNTDPDFEKEDSDDSSEESSTETNRETVTVARSSSSKRSISIPISIVPPQTKKPRKDDMSSHPALLRYKEAQLVQQHDDQIAELDVRNKNFNYAKKNSLPERSIWKMKHVLLMLELKK